MTYKEALYFLTHNGTTFDQELESHRMMVVAMHKQIPKKPIRNTGQINKAWIEQVALCPTCKEYVGSYDCRIFNKFCQYCGQSIEPIDWSDEE